MNELCKLIGRIKFKILSVIIILLAFNLRFGYFIFTYEYGHDVPIPLAYVTILETLCYVFVFYINIFPNLTVKKVSTLRNKIMEDGVALLQIFLTTTVIETVYCITLLVMVKPDGVDTGFNYPLIWISHLAIFFLAELVLFWNGILRVYLTSRQIGIKWRIIGIICGFMPLVHIYVLCRIIRIAGNEAEWENEKYILNRTRAENQECHTRYPILLVHGVFFRDFRFFNYWGRIPAELIKNGAVIYYGNQHSAASVERCGEELTRRIKEILQETGCEKVNIIAHSKGGLDSRYAISACGASEYVASLTTVNTPHRGCMFADYLLEKVPDKICNSIANKYNAALKKFGDSNPDFMEAVQDLTASSCIKLNEKLPDDSRVFYQSIGSKMNYASSGRFPLNMSYPLVKHFDGECDGLVSVGSMKWGSNFIYLNVPKGRGISHGDMIDLNRENIPGFDAMEFYVNLVRGLKERGF
ncbi:MAG: triacylglycerol lipase [Lachnospiraceae bacterium]|nr:triacylglycerol lipase [Lachnospiraceae bacterium]